MDEKTNLFVMTTGKRILLFAFAIVAILCVIYYTVNEYAEQKELELKTEVKSQNNEVNDVFNQYLYDTNVPEREGSDNNEQRNEL